MAKTSSRDIDLLQGTWFIRSLEMDGIPMPGMEAGNIRLTIAGSRFASIGMEAVYEGTLTIDDSVRPCHLEMTFDAGPEKGNTNYAIYQLKGDEWTICVNTLGTARPDRFEAEQGSGCALETLVRCEVAVSKRTPARKKTVEPKSASPATELEGEWKMVSGILDGRALDASMVEWVRRVTEGNITTVTAGTQTMLKAEFTVGDAGPVRTIDYLHLAGANRGKTQLGIYALDDQELRIFMAAAGADRPGAFLKSAGKGETLTVWTRA